MQPHAKDGRPTLRPGLARHRTLRCGSRGDCVLNSGKGDKERVALGVDLDAVVSLPDVAEKPVVRREQLDVGVTKLVQQAGGALHVGEQESHQSHRQIGTRVSNHHWILGLSHLP